MRISRRGIDLLSHFEGRALFAYDDPVNVCTVGVGHTLNPHRRCTRNDFARYGTRQNPKMTDAWVDRILRRDLRKFELAVELLVRKGTKQHEFDSLVSLAFNIGIGAFGKSTVLKEHNKGHSYRAGLAFLLWVKGGGQTLPGLVRRRRAERWLYRRGTVRTFA